MAVSSSVRISSNLPKSSRRRCTMGEEKEAGLA